MLSSAGTYWSTIIPLNIFLTLMDTLDILLVFRIQLRYYKGYLSILAQINIYSRFAVFGPTWPFVVCLREARTRVFMSNAGGLTPMLLLGLEVREEPGILITKRTVESLAWSGGDAIGKDGTLPSKRRKRIRRILLWILHLRLPHVGKKFHVFGKRKKSKLARKYDVKQSNYQKTVEALPVWYLLQLEDVDNKIKYDEFCYFYEIK